MAQSAEEALLEWADNATRLSILAIMRFNQAHNLSISLTNTLFYAARMKQLTINELAKHLGVSLPAASQLVDRIVEQGWLRRDECPHDRRSKLISLTESGSELVAAAKRERHAWIRELLLGFKEREKQKILPALKLMNQKITVFANEGELSKPTEEEN